MAEELLEYLSLSGFQFRLNSKKVIDLEGEIQGIVVRLKLLKRNGRQPSKMKRNVCLVTLLTRPVNLNNESLGSTKSCIAKSIKQVIISR